MAREDFSMETATWIGLCQHVINETDVSYLESLLEEEVSRDHPRRFYIERIFKRISRLLKDQRDKELEELVNAVCHR